MRLPLENISIPVEDRRPEEGPVTRERAAEIQCILPEIGEEDPPGSGQWTEAILVREEPPGSPWHFRVFLEQSIPLGGARGSVEMVIRTVIDGSLVFSIAIPEPSVE